MADDFVRLYLAFTRKTRAHRGAKKRRVALSESGSSDARKGNILRGCESITYHTDLRLFIKNLLVELAEIFVLRKPARASFDETALEC